MLKYRLVINLLVIAVIICFVNGDTANYDRPIGGRKTIAECINGYKPTEATSDPKMYATPTQFARHEGYLVEEHVVVTDDGYILTLHRIPGKTGAPPVFVQHGLVSSAYDWLLIGKEKALGFKLADAGYDVWLGNFRGNTYSRCHTKYTTSESKFWDFGWHEMGIYDLPAMITYITNTTAQKVIYVGHSMGTTAFFVMAIERPDIASNVKVMFALAPVAYIDHATSPLRLLAPYTSIMKLYLRAGGSGELLSQNRALKSLLKKLCTWTSLQRHVCTEFIFFSTGYNPRQFNYTLVPEVVYHVPAGSTLKSFAHYFQEYNSKKFEYYDYGAEKNLELYQSHTPPTYNISKITVPIGIFWSEKDLFANPADVMRLYKQLPNTILFQRVEDPNFNHADYLFAEDALNVVYEKLLSKIENYK